MSRKVILFVILFTSFCGAAYGDGKVFARKQFPSKIPIPNQRAIISFSDGEEKLIIETSFKGEGKEFAWVVPLPSEPEIEKVTTGTINTASYLFKPKLEYQSPEAYLYMIAVWFLFVLFFLLSKTPNFSPLAFIMFIFFGLLVLMCSIPSLLGGPRPPTADVDILQQKTVGSYDTAVISGREAGSLLGWLKKNGFAVPEDLEPAVQYYIDKGWVFAAAKIRRDNETSEKMATHPLCFTFKTDRAVYPLRMTAVDSGECSIELYVFGDRRAAIKNFTVEMCDKFEKKPGKDGVPIVHKGLKKIVRARLYGTKLTAKLTPDEMLEDAEVAWEPFGRSQKIIYSKSAARGRTLNLVVPFVLVALTIIFAAFFRVTANTDKISKYVPSLSVRYEVTFRDRKVSHLLIISLLTLLAGVAAYAVIYNQYETVEIKHKNWRGATPEQVAYYFNEKSEAKTPDEIRAYFRVELVDAENEYTGALVKEEDSPGNYLIRRTATGSIEFVSFGEFGEERLKELIPATKKTTAKSSTKLPLDNSLPAVVR